MPKISSGKSIKSPKELEKMVEGGRKLAGIKEELRNLVKEGARASQVEDLAVELIKKAGGRASFKMVPGYSWATCVNVNQGLVHGIPRKDLIFKNGDIVSVDIGFYYKEFHTDTAFSLAIGSGSKTRDFIKAGERALERSLGMVKPGKRIYDLSKAIQDVVEESHYFPIKALVGHGIGRALHEEPQIPCFLKGGRKESVRIEEGLVLAIEVMYALGSNEVDVGEDGWTISMRDGKISALFEETVAATSHGPLILTRS